MICDAIILAGGLGTRLREVVPELPKPLASVNGRPFLDILIEKIGRSGCVDNIVLAVGYKAMLMIERYRNTPLIFSIEQEPLGTGGAVAKAMKKTKSPNVFVFNGDSYCSCSLEKIVHAHRTVLTLACASVEDTVAYGRVEIDEHFKVRRFTEKGMVGPGLINGGIYLFDRNVFDVEGQALPTSFSLEKELIPKLVDKGIGVVISEGLFVDIGTKTSYLRAQTLKL